MNIADRMNVEFEYSKDKPDGLTDTGSLAHTLRIILSGKTDEGEVEPIAPADELMRLLIDLRAAFDGGPKEADEAKVTLDEAIELTFLYTPSYEAALDLYRFRMLGKSRGLEGVTLLPLLTPQMDKATGANQAEEIRGNGPREGTRPSESGPARKDTDRGFDVIDEASRFALSLGNQVDGQDADWRLKLRLFAHSLGELLADERTPERAKELLSDAVMQIFNHETDGFSVTDHLQAVVEQLQPERAVPVEEAEETSDASKSD